MTEEEWLACKDPVEMIVSLRFANGQPRKGTLFVSAVCRHMWDTLDEHSRRMLLKAELNEDVDWDSAEVTKVFERNLLREEA